jgi:hypothetical protein
MTRLSSLSDEQEGSAFEEVRHNLRHLDCPRHASAGRPLGLSVPHRGKDRAPCQFTKLSAVESDP